MSFSLLALLERHLLNELPWLLKLLLVKTQHCMICNVLVWALMVIFRWLPQSVNMCTSS